MINSKDRSIKTHLMQYFPQGRCFQLGNGRLRHVQVTRYVFVTWLLVTPIFTGTHLALFGREFRESWYGPLHFLWVIACSCEISWWCWRPDVKRSSAILQASVFALCSYGITWAVERVAWGGGVGASVQLPLDGLFLIGAALFLVVIPVVFEARSSSPGVRSAKGTACS